MPLRDHFRPPLSEHFGWEEVHGQWPAVIVQQLGKLLPRRYVAAPRVHLSWQAEIDIGTFEKEGDVGNSLETNGGGVATAVWTAATPTLAVETQLADFDEYEVRIYETRHGRRLVAAIELISPANKDRPENRVQFISKCAALLRQQVAVVLVDIVTVRAFNLYAELLHWVGADDASLADPPSATYAAACRAVPRVDNYLLQTWSHALEPGQPLPLLPLWLGEKLAVPLDLEAELRTDLPRFADCVRPR